MTGILVTACGMFFDPCTVGISRQWLLELKYSRKGGIRFNAQEKEDEKKYAKK